MAIICVICFVGGLSVVVGTGVGRFLKGQIERLRFARGASKRLFSAAA
jgi:hypothetical protein